MRILLAPMEGVIDHHFRALYSEIGGVDLCVSEFIRVNDLPVGRNVLLRDCPELRTDYRTKTSGKHNTAGPHRRRDRSQGSTAGQQPRNTGGDSLQPRQI